MVRTSLGAGVLLALSAFPFRRSLVGFLLLLGMLGACGCSGSGAAGKGDRVSGKVTLNSKPVSGLVVFVGSDGKEVTAPIAPDGQYTVLEPPHGEVKVLVRGLGGPSPGAGKAVKGKEEVPGGPSLEAGVPPPAKYSQPNNGLQLIVTGGAQTYDIDLTK